MDEDQNIERRLWNYIDDTICAEEKIVVEKLLLVNEKWQFIYRQILPLHQLVKAEIEMDEPSMRFTRNIMDEIAGSYIAPATKTYINKKIIYAIAAFFMILIGGLLIYSFAHVNWSDSADSGASFDLAKLYPATYFNIQFVNIFLMVYVVLGLILFDRVLSKNRNRSKRQQTR